MISNIGYGMEVAFCQRPLTRSRASRRTSARVPLCIAWSVCNSANGQCGVTCSGGSPGYGHGVYAACPRLRERQKTEVLASVPHIRREHRRNNRSHGDGHCAPGEQAQAGFAGQGRRAPGRTVARQIANSYPGRPSEDLPRSSALSPPPRGGQARGCRLPAWPSARRCARRIRRCRCRPATV